MNRDLSIAQRLEELTKKINDSNQKSTALIQAAKDRGIKRFQSANGCTLCRGRGWTVIWDTMDYRDGSAAEYADCPEEECTQESRERSGLYPVNNKYDYRRYSVWNHSRDLTDEENEQIVSFDAESVRLNDVFRNVQEEKEIRKGKLVEVTKKSRARNSAEPGTIGKVFWVGVNDWGTIKVGLMDTEGQKHWTTELCADVIKQVAGEEYVQKYEDQYPLLCKVAKKTNRAICVMTPGQNKFSVGEWIPWSQVLNAEQVRAQLKTGKAVTVMLPPWLAKKKGYINEKPR